MYILFGVRQYFYGSVSTWGLSKYWSPTKTLTHGSPLFGLWCVSSWRSIFDISQISSRRPGCIQSVLLQFHKVTLILSSVTWVVCRRLKTRSFYYHSFVSIKGVMLLYTSLHNSRHTRLDMLNLHLSEVFIYVERDRLHKPRTGLVWSNRLGLDRCVNWKAVGQIFRKGIYLGISEGLIYEHSSTR